MNFPQLRVRTGYTFRECFGRIPEVFDRLKDLGCDTFGIVEGGGTWSHVKAEKEAIKRSVNLMFGMEFPILCDDVESPLMHKYTPRAWALAEDLRQFYSNTSDSLKNGGSFREDFAAMKGIIKFCGAAIDRLQPQDYDYIDINPSSILLAKKGVMLHRQTGKPMVITCHNDLPSVEHSDYAYSWEVRSSVGCRTIEGLDEIWSHLKWCMTRDEFALAIENTFAVAERLKGKRLNKAPIIALEGDLVALARKGMDYRLKTGHIKEWTDEYELRFNEEIRQIQLKKFDSYFLMVADLVTFAKTKMIVGPARGSSAGSLICYCLRITEVDPLVYGLLFQRFIDISREDFPDIDIDFPNDKRNIVFEYVCERYGKENVSKMGNINTLKPTSAIAQVSKKFLVPIIETTTVKQSLIEFSAGDKQYGKSLENTMKETFAGKKFSETYPEAAACMANIELHPSHTGVHAAAILVCNQPISHFCTVNADGVAQIDKPDAEYLNLLKIDSLGLRTLGVIADAKCVDIETLYNLTFDDPKVFQVINDDKVSGVFQFEGHAVRNVTRMVNVDKFSKIDNLTALARPGPLASGMAVSYVERDAGREPVEYEHPLLEPHLRETKGIFLYQEQIMSVCRDIGGFDWAKTSAVRKAMSGSKGEEVINQYLPDFVAGAKAKGMNGQIAAKIWGEMAAFGKYGFNKSHSVSYAVITYWCCWLKVYHRLEFAAACLRDAKDDDQTIAILRELEKEEIHYTPIDPDFSQANWTVADGRLIGGIRNAKGFGNILSARYIEARENGKLTKAMRERLLKAEIKFSDLHEAHSRFGYAYNEPWRIGVGSGSPIENIKDIPDGSTGIFIAKLVKKTLADENESIRVTKRGGVLKKGLTQFIDLSVVDDSTDTPIRVRIRPKQFEAFGRHIAENVSKGAWFLVKGWKISGLDMFIVKNIKQISNSDEKEEKSSVENEETVKSEMDLAEDYLYAEVNYNE